MWKNHLLPVVAALGIGMASEPAHAVDALPSAPKVSTFAPADDLVGQADQYLDTLKTIVADKQGYSDDKEKIGRDANTLIVIALALGLHDRENKYKARAGAVMKAARKVAAAKDYAAAQQAVAALEQAAAGNGGAGGELKWEKVAALPELMKQVPMIHTKLKLFVKGSNFKKRAGDTAGYSAAIAAIAQGSIADTSATKEAGQVKQWQTLMAAMRDDAGAVNGAIHKGDAPAAAKAMKKLNHSCADCHNVFKPDAVIDEDK